MPNRRQEATRRTCKDPWTPQGLDHQPRPSCGRLGHVVFGEAAHSTKSPPPGVLRFFSPSGRRDVALFPSPASQSFFPSCSFRTSEDLLRHPDLRVGTGAGSTFRQSDVDVNSNGRRRGSAIANVERRHLCTPQHLETPARSSLMGHLVTTGPRDHPRN
ncbi:uncharacterized protein LOC143647646 [Tamandua tetradactyla]|uniref:uncharacterized protein LOC143647646 n=1 Tax=Tamandua tetradactyla TaxID=48850 RepID=UPI0040543CC8